MSRHAEDRNRPIPAWGKVLLLWSITVVLAGAAVLSLQSWQTNLIEHIAFTDAPPERQAAFLIDRADAIFESLQQEAQASGNTAPGALKDHPRAIEAITYYARALELSGGVAPGALHERMATLYSWMGDDELMHQALARGFMAARDAAGAIDAAAQTRSLPGLVLLGEAHLMANQLDEARRLATTLTQKHPVEPDALMLLAQVESAAARAEAAAGRPDTAVRLWTRCTELLEEVLRLDGQRVAVYPMLADHYRLIGQLERSEATLMRAIRLFPSNANLAHRLGLIQLEAGKPADAAQSISRAISILDHIPDLHLDLRRALLAAGDNAGAARALERAMSLDADYVNRTLQP
jgi:tetratricopeptide (TPR) repeat protein